MGEAIILPGNQVLGKDEQLCSSEKFMSSLWTFYMKSDFAVTNKRFIGHYPNVLLWFIPAGMNNITFNLKQISWVQIDVSYKFLKVLMGLAISIFWLLSLVAGIGFIILPLWIIILASGIATSIKVASSGWVNFMPIIFWEKQKAVLFIQELNRVIAENT